MERQLYTALQALDVAVAPAGGAAATRQQGLDLEAVAALFAQTPLIPLDLPAGGAEGWYERRNIK